MKDRDLSFDRTCHVLYSKACKKQIQQKIALHYPPEQREAVWEQVQLQYVAVSSSSTWPYCDCGYKKLTSGKGAGW